MTACAHLSEHDRPCGRPAVRVWFHPVLGEWPLCSRHHESANVAVAASVFTGTPWTHEPVPSETPQDAPGRPEAAGAA